MTLASAPGSFTLTACITVLAVTLFHVLVRYVRPVCLTSLTRKRLRKRLYDLHRRDQHEAIAERDDEWNTHFHQQIGGMRW